MADMKTVNNNNNVEVFEKLCDKISEMVYSKKLGYEKELSQILESISAINFNFIHIKKKVNSFFKFNFWFYACGNVELTYRFLIKSMYI